MLRPNFSLIAFVALGASSTCAQAQADKRTVSGEIVCWGEPPFEKVVDEWGKEFDARHPDIKVRHFLKGSATSVGALYTGVANVGLLGRELHRNEIVTWKRIFPYEPLVFAVATGSFDRFAETVAPAIVVNARNPISGISFKQLDAIYSYDRRRGAPEHISTWGQLGVAGEWSRQPITIYGLDPDTGTADFLKTLVLKDGRWSYDARIPKGAPDARYSGSGRDAADALVRAIENDPYAIGIAGFRNLTAKLKALPVSEADAGPFVAGSLETVMDRTYPLSRNVYLFVNKNPKKAWDPVVLEFVKFVLSLEGQEAITRAGVYYPLPRERLEQERRKLVN